MIYPIVAYGDPVLKAKAKDIEEGSLDVKALAEDMFETMYQAQGVGLAAPQIGKSLRMFVVDGGPMEDPEVADFKRVFINPLIIEEVGADWGFEEGCLSIPGIREEVKRKESLTIRYRDLNWEEKEEELDGLAARIVQHEYDHIEGVLFTDYIGGLRKRLMKGKLADISKGKVSASYPMRFPLVK